MLDTSFGINIIPFPLKIFAFLLVQFIYQLHMLHWNGGALGKGGKGWKACARLQRQRLQMICRKRRCWAALLELHVLCGHRIACHFTGHHRQGLCKEGRGGRGGGAVGGDWGWGCHCGKGTLLLLLTSEAMKREFLLSIAWKGPPRPHPRSRSRPNSHFHPFSFISVGLEKSPISAIAVLEKVLNLGSLCVSQWSLLL